MEHVEEAGVHSGDSACVVPPQTLTPDEVERIIDLTRRLAFGLGVRGLLNIQFAVRDGEVWVLEANPQWVAHRPVHLEGDRRPAGQGGDPGDDGPVAVRPAMPPGSCRRTGADHLGVAIKEAVLPWKRFPAEDRVLGPEMRATGEVMGWAPTIGGAYAKALRGAGHVIPTSGTVFLSLRRS